jgi:hypothetical protein
MAPLVAATAASQPSAEPFAYRPLDLSTTQIRLLYISRGPPESMIECKLWHADLEDEHFCLSYT